MIRAHYEQDNEEYGVDGAASGYSLMVSEEGVKKMAMEMGTAGDYRTKFREIVWTSDINKEMPIIVLPDKLG